MPELERPERLQIMRTADELAALENWRYDNRMPSGPPRSGSCCGADFPRKGSCGPIMASSRRIMEYCPPRPVTGIADAKK